jgi:hypothetical protein
MINECEAVDEMRNGWGKRSKGKTSKVVSVLN